MNEYGGRCIGSMKKYDGRTNINKWEEQGSNETDLTTRF